MVHTQKQQLLDEADALEAQATKDFLLKQLQRVKPAVA